MRVTFPHLGNVYVPLRSLFNNLGTEVVVPPPCTRRTLELGSRYSPEFVCLPLKINVGNFIEALELGADTLVIPGGWGPCRFGYYAQIEREILSELGYKFRMVVLEAPDSKLTSLLAQIRQLGKGATAGQVVHAVKMAWKKMVLVDECEKMYYDHLPTAVDPYLLARAYETVIARLDRSEDEKELDQIYQSYQEQLKEAAPMGEPDLTIAVVGEIYTIIEPFANFQIVERLGRLGVRPVKSLYLTEWINDHLLKGLLPVGSSRKVLDMSKPYLNHWVGGHGRESVAYAVKYAREGFDGVIQLGPLTCMPEIVAQAVLPVVSREEQIPVMTLYVDEQTGEAGFQTRIEAFVDMVRRKKTRGGLREVAT